MYCLELYIFFIIFTSQDLAVTVVLYHLFFTNLSATAFVNMLIMKPSQLIITSNSKGKIAAILKLYGILEEHININFKGEFEGIR